MNVENVMKPAEALDPVESDAAAPIGEDGDAPQSQGQPLDEDTAPFDDTDPTVDGQDAEEVLDTEAEDALAEGPMMADEPAPNSYLLRTGLEELAAFVRDVDDVDHAIEAIAEAGDRSSARNARKIQRQMKKIEPSVTMIGQVKAGKTSLVNALVGWPDLLPADVNPWTSVVTSLHINSKPIVGGNHASFEFFEEDEWTRLLERGGRMGELAGRAGADDELQKVSAQLEEMREKSRARLGNKFEMLMGQEHSYGYFDSELIQRYVCLGDDFEDDTETSSSQGRFADITKAAELFLHREEYPMDFCIRDTPGVNDTFMMREQITIRAIRESRMCVVVLSAHQALSTVDMALIRLISNLPSREVIIFVNRIDELGDPSTQVPEIRESIRKTLAEHQGPTNAEIIFGSAYWANHVLSAGAKGITEESQTALFNWAETALTEDQESLKPDEMIWELSGVPALLNAVSARVREGSGHEVLTKAARSGMNILNGLAAGDHVVSMRVGDNAVLPLERKALPNEINRIESEALAALSEEFAEVVSRFHTRLERSHKSFLERATAALIRNLERYGDTEVWQYDATGLRVLLRSAYQVFARDAQRTCQNLFLSTTAEIRELYLRAFNVPDASFKLEAPTAPYVQPPVMLGQTIALDLATNWWGRWWRRRKGYSNYAVDFAALIKAETDPIVEGLKSEHVHTLKDDAHKILREFVQSQRDILDSLAARADTRIDDIQSVGSSEATREREQALAASREVLEQFVGDQGDGKKKQDG
jgi:signal recognition particle receptor subunit beta